MRHAPKSNRPNSRWFSSPLPVVGLLALMAAALYVTATVQPFGGSSVNSDSLSNRFSLVIEGSGDRVELQGESEFVATPSSFSIQMAADDRGRCVLHMLNFSALPGPGRYEIDDVEEVRTAMVCLLQTREPRERLASVSGRFTILRMDAAGIKGRFQMELDGPLSGERFTVKGEVEAVNVPLNLRFSS